MNHGSGVPTAGVSKGGEGEGGADCATDAGSDDGLNVAPGAVGGRGIRRCLGIDVE